MSRLALVTMALLVLAAAVNAGDVVVVNPAPGGEVKNIRVGDGGQPGGQAYGYYAAYAPPAPVPPGVASVYNMPCATPQVYRMSITAEQLLYGEERRPQ